MQTLEGRITRVIFHRPSQYDPAGAKYLIARLDPPGITVKGPFDWAAQGMLCRFWGDYAPDPRTGDDCFVFEAADQVLPHSAESIAWFLEDRIPGLGRVRSLKAVELWGNGAVAALREDPTKALELGVPEATVQEIREWFASNPDPEAFARLATLLHGCRVPRKTLAKIARDLGNKAAETIRKTPYLLLQYPRLGWKTVDQFATSVCEVPTNSLVRRAAGVIVAMEEITRNEGHTLVPKATADFEASKLLGLPVGDDAWEFLSDRDDEIASEGETLVGLASVVRSERRIADQLARLNQFGPSPFDPAIDPTLSEEQADAVRLLCASSVACLVGGPGTGKTYTLSRMLLALENELRSAAVVAAPTGNAAKRAGELLANAGCYVPTKTVHSMLGMASKKDEDAKERVGKTGRFNRDLANPLEEKIVVIDEKSMVDAPMAAAAFEAVASGSRLILCGDPHQLPSVGPGAVLRDLVESGSVPVARLTQTRRNSGRIVEACHAMLRNQLPGPSARVDLESGENWAHVEMNDPSAIADRIVQTVAGLKTFDKFWDVQVISPQNKSLPCACGPLNAKLSKLLNPRDSSSETDEDDEKFQIGDKIVRTKNARVRSLVPMGPKGDFDWSDGKFESEKPECTDDQFRWQGQNYAVCETDVVNGDLGEVLDLIIGDPKDSDPLRRASWVAVKFRYPERLCLLPAREPHIERAYAMTVHKAQGKGFPCVILPSTARFYWDERSRRGVWCRELVYTAFSRAEKLLITVGSLDDLHKAVSRPTIHQRRTTLKERLKA